MTTNFQAPTQIDLTDTETTLMTVGSTAGTIFKDGVVKVTNNTSATRLVYVYAVPSGASVSDTNAAANGMSVPARDYILIPVGRLGASGSIQAKADQTSSLTISLVSGNEYTP